MSRMHGERQEMYQARRAFAVEAHIATMAKEAEYALKRANGIPLPVVEVTPACTCSLRPYPHVHSDEEFRRFKLRMPPGNEERERYERQ
jgi:hypothetical protein